MKELFPRATSSQKFFLLFASGFGSGYSPFASGTVGSAVAVVLYLLFQPLLGPAHPVLGLIFLLTFWAFSVHCAEVAEKYYGKKDDGRVVIDEFLGQWITLFLVPLNLWTPVAAFFIFRIFDIAKPFPAGWSQKLRGGVGIVMDDLIAGIYGCVLMHLIIWFL